MDAKELLDYRTVICPGCGDMMLIHHRMPGDFGQMCPQCHRVFAVERWHACAERMRKQAAEEKKRQADEKKVETHEVPSGDADKTRLTG